MPSPTSLISLVSAGGRQRSGAIVARVVVDRAALSLMCQAITQGFCALRQQGVGGAPRSLALLHRAILRPVAVRYWARAMSSPMGELCFAAHVRHAKEEMVSLADAALERLGNLPNTESMRLLLEAF